MSIAASIVQCRGFEYQSEVLNVCMSVCTDITTGMPGFEFTSDQLTVTYCSPTFCVHCLLALLTSVTGGS
jgi:hypothetical protein